MKNFDEIVIHKSRGKSGAVASIRENVLFPDDILWPPIELVKKMSKSGKIIHFPDSVKPILQKELGYYCDLQSIKSEDAITWSLFGYIARQEHDVRNKFYKEFLAKIGIGIEDEELESIDLWSRLPHPETGCKNGPEIDVLIIGKKYYFLIECKWTSKIGVNQGIKGNLNQIEIRQLFADEIGKGIFPNKEGRIIFVGNDTLESFASVTWNDFSKFTSLPHKEEFIKYINWKKKFI